MAKKRRRRGSAQRTCPCGSGRSYGDCCGPFHRGEQSPDTPVELMRSRYSAYALGLIRYVVDTTDPDGGAWEADMQAWRRSIRSFHKQMEFVGVDVLDDQVDGDRGEVRFRARLKMGESDATFVERSEFVRRDGRWLYSDGDLESAP